MGTVVGRVHFSPIVSQRYILDPSQLCKQNQFNVLSDHSYASSSKIDSSENSPEHQSSFQNKIPPIFLHEVNNHQEIVKDIKNNVSHEFSTTVKGKSLKINLSDVTDFRTLTSFYEQLSPFHYIPYNKRTSYSMEETDSSRHCQKGAARVLSVDDSKHLLPTCYYQFSTRNAGLGPDKMSVKKYNEADLDAAVSEVKRGGLSKKAASIKYKVPRSTIQFRLSKNFVKKEKGPDTILSKEEEGVLVKWVNECCRKGFPRRKEDILISVKEFLDMNKRRTILKNNYPGRGWYRAFLRRHPEIVPRKPEAVTNASSCVSESNIRNWFTEIESVLKEEGCFEILKDPERVFNGDETNLLLCPNNSTVLAPKGTKNVYEIEQGKSKSAVTVMFSFSASGKVVPPMIIYPYKRIPADVVQSVPNHWGIGHSDSGWMKAEVFFEYIGNVFNHYLIQEKVKLPVILFVDGHKTHLTYQLSQLCTELKIVVVALYPNATRILQPADVAAFRPIKHYWKQGVMEWRRTHPNDAITKLNVAPILKDVIPTVKPKTLENGFKACGLCPWNVNEIDFSKCLGKDRAVLGTPDCDENLKSTMTKSSFELIIGEQMLTEFKNIERVVENEQKPNEFYLLYRLWEEFERGRPKSHSMKNMCTETSTQTEDISEISRPTAYIDGDKIQLEHSYSTPTKKFLDQPSQSVVTPVAQGESTPFTQSSANSSVLADVLTWPETPKRKGTRVIERAPFVVTSKKWKELFEEKEKKKKQEESAKAERKRKREEARKKTEENEMAKKVKKENQMVKTSKQNNAVVIKNKRRPNVDFSTGGTEKSSAKKESQKVLTMKDIKLLKNKNTKSEMVKKFQEQCSSEYDDNTQASSARVDKVTPTSSFGKKRVQTHVSGLCYCCGRGFKPNDEAVECDMCDKVYHVTCVISEISPIDKNDPVFICQPCLKFGDDILKDLGSKVKF